MGGKMINWVITGISGSGRIELLNDLAEHAKGHDLNVKVHDVGALIRQECEKNNIKIIDSSFLDIDPKLLQSYRANAIQQIQIDILKNKEIDINLIGVHCLFRWKQRLIPGVSFRDLSEFEIDGFINVVDNVKDIVEINKKNPKWTSETLPDFVQTQEWMLEEEFVTQLMADIMQKPFYVIARHNNIGNIYDIVRKFNKKKIYLSYPITAVKDTDPEILSRIQGPILEKLEEKFIVFNPLAIEDMMFVTTHEKLPESEKVLSITATELIKTRTVERDFRFIEQSDAVVVFYLTDKLSPGVLAEIIYAHNNQTPVYMVFDHSKSPFLENVTTIIAKDIDELMSILEKYAES